MNKTYKRMMRAVTSSAILIAMLSGSMGLSCGGDAMQAFRQESFGDIGEGIRMILNAVLDGTAAAINEVGNTSATEG